MDGRLLSAELNATVDLHHIVERPSSRLRQPPCCPPTNGGWAQQQRQVPGKVMAQRAWAGAALGCRRGQLPFRLRRTELSSTGPTPQSGTRCEAAGPKQALSGSTSPSPLEAGGQPDVITVGQRRAHRRQRLGSFSGARDVGGPPWHPPTGLSTSASPPRKCQTWMPPTWSAQDVCRPVRGAAAAAGARSGDGSERVGRRRARVQTRATPLPAEARRTLEHRSNASIRDPLRRGGT